MANGDMCWESFISINTAVKCTFIKNIYIVSSTKRMPSK